MKEPGGNCGNLFVSIPGCSHQAAKPILLAAHMDTVVPGKGKKAFVSEEDGRISGNGQAVLGADDVTGIVEIIEGIRILQENGYAHRPVEILLSVLRRISSRSPSARSARSRSVKPSWMAM